MEQFGAHTKAAGNNRAALARAAAVRAALTQPPRQPAPLVHEVPRPRPRLPARRQCTAHPQSCTAAMHAEALLQHRRAGQTTRQATAAAACAVVGAAALNA